MPDRLPVGVNLDFVRDYSSEVPFVDLFRTVRPWISQQQGAEWGEGAALIWTNTAGSADWPRVNLRQRCCVVRRGVPNGKFTCLYDGKGRLDFEGNARVIRERPGRMTVLIEPPGECLVHLKPTPTILCGISA